MPTEPLTAAERLFESWLTRCEAGEDVSADAWCAAHPEHASEMRALFAEWAALQSLGPGDPPVLEVRPDAESLEHAASERLMKIGRLSRHEGRYEGSRHLGKGHAGRVAAVRDTVLGRWVAEKALIRKSSAGTHALAIHRFVDEAQLIAQLDHPGLIPIYDIHVGADSCPVYIMRAVRGRTGAQVLEDLRATEGPRSFQPVLEMLIKVCEAVGYAHSRGVAHRDLKPANLLVGDRGEVYVIDWGLAASRDLEGGHQHVDVEATVTIHTDIDLTLEGDIFGTPGYMAPEQAAGEDVGVEADVYSLGAVLYHALTGRIPHVGEAEDPSWQEVLGRARAGPPEAVRHLATGAPRALVRVCERAMAWEPEQRYPSASAMASALRDVRDGWADRWVRALSRSSSSWRVPTTTGPRHGSDDPQARREADAVKASDAERWLASLRGKTSPHERYRRGAVISKGSHTAVYEGRDQLLHRTVAMKCPRLDDEGEGASRLLLEAQLTSQLNHPSIPIAYEVCLDAAGAPILVMQRVRGRRLFGKSGEPVSLRSACEAVLAVSEAVAYAHDRSVIHHDVHPRNIVVGGHGEVVLLDWSLAFHDSAAGWEQSLSTTDFLRTQVHLHVVENVDPVDPLAGRSAGAVECMAPECLEGDAPDVLSDVYSLGATLAAMLVGVGRLWGAEAGARPVQEAIAWRRSHEALPDLSRLPKRLRRVVGRSLSGHAEDRHESAGQFAEALRGFLYR